MTINEDAILQSRNELPTLTTLDDHKYLMFLTGLLQEKTGNIAEIGVYKGASAVIIRKAMDNNCITGELYLIDIFRYPISNFRFGKPLRMSSVKLSESFKSGTKEAIPNSIIIEGYSDDVSLDRIKPISFLFLDADHSVHGCLLELLKYSQLMPQIIAIHDNWSPKVIRAIDIFLSIRHEYTILGEQGSITALSQ